MTHSAVNLRVELFTTFLILLATMIAI